MPGARSERRTLNFAGRKIEFIGYMHTKAREGPPPRKKEGGPREEAATQDHLLASSDPATPSWTPEKRDSAEAAAETEAVQLELNLIYATDKQSR
jgi:hypothetical protein